MSVQVVTIAILLTVSVTSALSANTNSTVEADSESVSPQRCTDPAVTTNNEYLGPLTSVSATVGCPVSN